MTETLSFTAFFTILTFSLVRSLPLLLLFPKALRSVYAKWAIDSSDGSRSDMLGFCLIDVLCEECFFILFVLLENVFLEWGTGFKAPKNRVQGLRQSCHGFHPIRRNLNCSNLVVMGKKAFFYLFFLASLH